MSDGYQAYRRLGQRLRCWAYLIRKCQGLVDSTDAKVAAGKGMHEVMNTLMEAIYGARSAPGQENGVLAIRHAADIERLRELCVRHRDSRNDKLRALAREFLLDWEVILRQVSEPDLPLNAEQALRHWIIAPHQYGHTQRGLLMRVRVACSVIETIRKKMKTIYALIFLTILMFQNLCFAQNRSNQAATGNNTQPQNTASLNEYLSLPDVNDAKKIDKLESIDARGLPKTSENFSRVVKLLNSTVSNGQKVILVRLLTSFHSKDNRDGTNQKIEARLRELALSSDKSLATSALLRYSRLGYFSDTEALLNKNFGNGFISKNDLYGELAHVINFAGAADQLRLIEQIRRSKNSYAIDILAASVKSDEARRYLPAASKIALHALLEQNQPKFSLPIGEFSLGEAIVYSDWLHTLASLKSENAGISYDDVIMSELDNATSNPKKAIAFLSSPEGKLAASRIGQVRLAGVTKRISDFSESLPFLRVCHFHGIVPYDFLLPA